MLPRLHQHLQLKHLLNNHYLSFVRRLPRRNRLLRLLIVILAIIIITVTLLVLIITVIIAVIFLTIFASTIVIRFFTPVTDIILILNRKDLSCGVPSIQ